MDSQGEWQELVDGFPDEPKRSEVDDLVSLPTPHDFFERAFLDLCGVNARKTTETGRVEEPPFARKVYGFQGTEEIGLRWVEEQDRESSMVPLYSRSMTYGLPGMTIYWKYRWEYASQYGHSAFRHGKLKALFDNPAAEKRFVAIWRIVFGKTPVFSPNAEPPPDVPSGPSSSNCKDSRAQSRVTTKGPVQASVELAVAIRDCWESRLAPLYSSAQVQQKDREELIRLREYLESWDVKSARPIVKEWKRYHETNGEFADTLTSGFSHFKLAELCGELLDLLPAE